MSLANKPCYPQMLYSANSEGQMFKEYNAGLTFRERLIIALASNVGTIINNTVYHKEIAGNIIKQADAIIEEMEKQ